MALIALIVLLLGGSLHVGTTGGAQAAAAAAPGTGIPDVIGGGGPT